MWECSSYLVTSDISPRYIFHDTDSLRIRVKLVLPIPRCRIAPKQRRSSAWNSWVRQEIRTSLLQK